MRTHFLSTLSFLLIALAFALPAQAQKFQAIDASPADVALYRVDGAPMVKVVYSRPSKKGRDLFGALVPYGKVWRTGANEATEIRLYQDGYIAGERVEAGIYSLFTIPGEEEWSIIFSNQTDVWGAYQYDAEQNVVVVTVPASEGDESVEAFSIGYQEIEDGVNMILAWGNTRVAIPITF